ncbi:hypothetical protein [Parasitella parasitica]|uniref:CCHC-type domain-containing protein n=1 Tax=Parasitella parasitica TaxID=35722 RepID=A0A0B7MWX8_9FUNG|nr:hypothetical protein [Parasitella parasitica]
MIRLEKTNDISLLPTVLYEQDDLQGQIFADKATDIIQQSLSSDSALFSFPKSLFGVHTDAYRLIQEQISPDVEFRPLSLYDERSDGSLLVEARFIDEEIAHRPMEEGIQVEGVQYKAVSANRESSSKDLKHVHFTLFRIVNEENFLQGFFEDKMSMVIDTSAGYKTMDDEWHESKPLGRILYLSAFDCFVPAVSKGAPTICHFCRQGGHIRSACLELAKRRCFGCNQQDHMLRFCPDGKRSDNTM